MSELGRWMAAAGLTLFPLLSSVNLAHGQVEPTQPRQAVPPPAAGAQQGGGMVSDRELVQWLIIDNQGEVQISQLGQKQSENEAVREFSQQMVKEHTEFIEKLQNVAGGGARPGAVNPRQPNRDNEGAAADIDGKATEPVLFQRDAVQPSRTAQPAGREATRRSGPVDLVTLKRELGQECVQSTSEMLKQYEGADFDQAFMGTQLVLHQQMLDTLNVFRRHAQSQQLQQLLAEGAKSTEEHLQHAREIMKDLDGGSSSGERPRTARKPKPAQQERE